MSVKVSMKRELFCQGYLAHGNATKAAISAGYSENSAASIGCQLLQKVSVRLRVEELKSEFVGAVRVTKEKVVQELARLAFFNPLDYFSIDGNTQQVRISDLSALAPGEGAAIKSIKDTRFGLQVELQDKRAALESLGKYLGMFTDKHEFSGPGGGPIETSYTVEFVDSE